MAIGVWAGISGLGIAIGPVVGGILVDNFGWASVFWVNVPIGIIAVGVCLWAVVESSDPTATRLDIVGTVLVTTSLLALTFGLIKTNEYSWTSPFIVSLLGGAVVLLAAWLWWEMRVTEPMVPLSFFRVRQFTVANSVAVLVGVTLFGSLYFVTLYFQNIKGYSALEAGVRSMPMTLIIMFIAPVAGRLNGMIGPRPLMTTGMLLAAGGMAGLSQLTPTSSYNAIWPFFIMLGAGISLTMPALSGAAMSAVDPAKSGIASGVLNSARQVGGAIGIAVMGSVVAKLAADDFGAAPQQLQQLVVGGQTRLVGQLAGAAAQSRAAAAFVTGMHGAMWAGAALTLLAAAVSWFGLRSGSAQSHAHQATPVEMI
jgi:DHA2 family methylenomycin A resistance protein-like MFS transporter